MKLIVDSNYLRDPRLRSYLRASKSNFAVLPDYAAMEALKKDPNITIHKSMETLSDYPDQVQILKSTKEICGLSGASKGLQRRLVDNPQTTEFPVYCRRLKLARDGNQHLVGQLAEHGVQAREHIGTVQDDAAGFAISSVNVANAFTRAERRTIRTGRPWPPRLLDKLVNNVMTIADYMFEDHPAVKRYPTPKELINTYIFRSAICNLMLGFVYADVGGVAGKASDKVTNDMIDCHFATYATFFDGLLSNDKMQVHIYQISSTVLSRFIRLFRL